MSNGLARNPTDNDPDVPAASRVMEGLFEATLSATGALEHPEATSETHAEIATNEIPTRSRFIFSCFVDVLRTLVRLGHTPLDVGPINAPFSGVLVRH